MVSRTRRQKTLRLLARWITTPKPTEWLSATAAVIGVGVTITAGMLLINNGFFDQKKSELEAKNSVLELKNIKLEMDTKELTSKRDNTGKQVLKLESDLEMRKEELASLGNRLKNAEKATLDAEAKYATYAKHEEAIRTLENLGKEDGKQIQPSVKYYGNMSSFDNFSVSLSAEGDREDGFVKPTSCYNREIAIKQLVNIKNLKKLSIKNIKLLNSDMAFISQLRKLEVIELTNCGISDEGMAVFSIPKTVAQLDLSYNPAVKIPNIEDGSNLIHLNIEGSRFQDFDIARIIMTSQKLKYVTAQVSEFGDLSLSAVCSKNLQACYFLSQKSL